MKERPPSLIELAIEATASTRQGYNLLAPRFELTPYATPLSIIESCRKRADELFPPSGHGVGVDLGCGTGRAAFSLSESCEQVVGFDFSPKMIEQARLRADFLGMGDRVQFLERDLARVELDIEAYDRIVTFGAWGHILPPWRVRLIEAIGRALKLGGVFYTVTADPMGPWNLSWWKSALFDTAIRIRNRLIKERFDMYYLLNDTVTVKRIFEEHTSCRVRIEPIHDRPHPLLSLLIANRE